MQSNSDLNSFKVQLGKAELLREILYAEAATALNDNIAELANNVNANIENLSDALSTEIENLSDALSTEIENLSDALSTEIENLSDALSTEIENLSTSLSNTVDDIINNLDIGNNINVYLLTGDTTNDITALIANSDLTGVTFKNADVILVTSTANGATASNNIKIPYQYNEEGNTWYALVGNINAKNIMLTRNIVCAGDYTLIGNITKALDETYTIPVIGKSVDDVITTIFTAELAGSIKTQPSTTITSKPNISKEVGDTVNVNDVVVAASFSPGEYTYGPDTGVKPNKYTFTFSGIGTNRVIDVNTNNTSTGNQTLTGDAIAITDGINCKVALTTAYDDATAYAYTNLGRKNSEAEGKSYADVKITSGTKSVAATTIISGFRYMYIGSVATTTALAPITETFIKQNLNAFKSGSKNVYVKSNPGTNDIRLVNNAKRVIIAIPASGSYKRTLSDVILTSYSDTTSIKSSYELRDQVNVSGKVAGANLIAYNIYVYEPDLIGSTEVHLIKIA